MEESKCETKAAPRIRAEVGRTLYYYPFASEGLAGAPGPLAAKIVAVHSQECVNLVVWTANGDSLPRCSVRLVQPGENVPAEGFAAWMPFSVDMAAKRCATLTEGCSVRAAVAEMRHRAAERETLAAQQAERTLRADPDAKDCGAPNEAVPVPDPNAPAPAVEPVPVAEKTYAPPGAGGWLKKSN